MVFELGCVTESRKEVHWNVQVLQNAMGSWCFVRSGFFVRPMEDPKPPAHLAAAAKAKWALRTAEHLLCNYFTQFWRPLNM